MIAVPEPARKTRARIESGSCNSETPVHWPASVNSVAFRSVFLPLRLRPGAFSCPALSGEAPAWKLRQATKIVLTLGMLATNQNRAGQDALACPQSMYHLLRESVTVSVSHPLPVWAGGA